MLRHSVAVYVLDAGEDIAFAKDHLGHKWVQPTSIYAQISDSNRTMRRLEKSRDFPLRSRAFRDGCQRSRRKPPALILRMTPLLAV